MAFFKSSQNIIALATKQKNQYNSNMNENQQNNNKNSKRLCIELYVLGQEGCLLAQLGQNIEFIDMEFVQKKRIILLVKQYNQFYFYFLQPNKKLKKKQVNLQNPIKFISQDRRIILVGQKGMKQLDGEVQNLSSELRFQKMTIQDYAIIDNQFQIILSNNKLYCFHDLEMIHSLPLSQFSENNSVIQAKSIVRVGRNLLVAHKNSITLSHFVIDNNHLKFLNNFTYKEKIRGGIQSMEVSFDQMHLAMSVELIQKEYTKIQNFMFNLSILSSQKKFINPFIRMIPLGTENTQITSLQGVIASETYYLAGNTIVNYSHNDQIQKKFKYSLHETPKQIAVHPLGYQFVCVFQTQIKFYLKIQNQLVQIWSQQMICSHLKYNVSGLLLISCLQQNFYQLIVYDTNSFKRLRSIPNIYIKHPVSKIELAQQDSQVIIYVDRDISIYKLKNGQKIAQYRQKKEKDKQQTLAIAYDPNWLTLLISTSNKSLLYCKKIDQIGWDFKFQRLITLPQEVTCIQINYLLQTAFFGTKSGKLLWTKYPLVLTEDQDLKTKLQLNQLKLNSNPISQIHLTNNLKYMFVSFKGQGLVICKMRKIIKYQGNTRFNEFDISNLNFLETSSKNSLESGYQKLKVLLQKRKTVFNDLDQYKKQWQIKKNRKIKELNKDNKFKELNHINESLNEVQKLKKQKASCHQQLKKLQQQTQLFFKQKQQNYQKEILQYYNQNIDLRVKKQKKIKQCQNQYRQIQEKCRENIFEINQELEEKYTIFMDNFQMMKKNMLLFNKRLEIEKKQAQQILLEIFKQKRQKLSIQQNDQNKKSNELKALITKYKKQSERYESRKYFLQTKKNFFIEQLIFCRNQKDQLVQIKNQLEEELKELEILTNKKQKRLRKYFKENQILTKYQLIHNNLITNLDQQVKFLSEQRDKTGKNIISIQKELSQIAELNQSYQQKIIDYNKKTQKMKQKNYLSAQKIRYLLHVIQQMSQTIQKTKVNLNQQNKASLFGSIYRDFFIKRQLQKIIQSSQNIDPIKQQEQIEYKIFNSAQNKKQVLQNMKKHKNYLQKNMMLFQKHNKKTDEEMNLNYLKYQTQNYNLIAECNVRKQQTNKKKRILHQLIDSVKQTQLYMNELQKENIDEAKMMKSMSVQKKNQLLPFFAYKQNKQKQQKSRIKIIRKEQSEPNLIKTTQSTYQVRKLLESSKIIPVASQNKLQRRIKTAMIKNRRSQHTVDHTLHTPHQSSEYIDVCGKNRPIISKKPMTANGKRHQSPFGHYYQYTSNKVKSTSKPTTCTAYTSKNKVSIYH